jgi:hypothetical protein
MTLLITTNSLLLSHLFLALLDHYETNPKLKRCFMHASITISITNYFRFFFETPPNHPTTRSSSTTTLWMKFTVASPPLPCPLVFGRRRKRIHANLGHCLRKPCSSPHHSLSLILLEEDTTLDPLHRPTQPTRAFPCTPHAQTDIALPPLFNYDHSPHQPPSAVPFPPHTTTYPPRTPEPFPCSVAEKKGGNPSFVMQGKRRRLASI